MKNLLVSLMLTITFAGLSFWIGSAAVNLFTKDISDWTAILITLGMMVWVVNMMLVIFFWIKTIFKLR